MIGPVRNENGSPARDPLRKTQNKSHNYCIIPVDKVYDKTVKNYHYRDRPIPFSGAGGVCQGRSLRNSRITGIGNSSHKEWRGDRRSPALNVFLAFGRNERDEEP